jgi:hypothetical protein
MPSDFNNPKFARDGFGLQCFGECTDGGKQFGVPGAAGQTDNSDARINQPAGSSKGLRNRDRAKRGSVTQNGSLYYIFVGCA